MPAGSAGYELEDDLNLELIEQLEVVTPSTKEYWDSRCSLYGVSNNAMLLDKQAEAYEPEERAAILGHLEAHVASYEGRRVVDLGCGIGRYTAHFVERGAASVLAVDICDAFVAANAERHRAHAHRVECLCSSAFDVRQPEGSVDLLFSNWLLMYAPDDGLEAALERFASWLKPDGLAFFRESCVTSISGLNPPNSPARYRNPEDYEEAFAKAFEVVARGRLELYVRLFKNPNQRYWVLRRRVQ